jgi:exonuclease III
MSETSHRTPLRLLTLNIRHGGGRRTEAIADALTSSDAEVIILTEFRENASARVLRERLAAKGWQQQASSEPPARTNGVFVAARAPFTAMPAHVGVPEGSWRWLEIDFGALTLVATYFPLSGRKLPYWDWVMERARERTDAPCILMGDFNTGKHFIDETGATFFGSKYPGQLEELGWIDAWRSLHPDDREYTWYSHKGNGFRLDYAWLSPRLRASLLSATHLDWTRVPDITDHAALMITLANPAQEPRL